MSISTAIVPRIKSVNSSSPPTFFFSLFSYSNFALISSMNFLTNLALSLILFLIFFSDLFWWILKEQQYVLLNKISIEIPKGIIAATKQIDSYIPCTPFSSVIELFTKYIFKKKSVEKTIKNYPEVNQSYKQRINRNFLKRP